MQAAHTVEVASFERRDIPVAMPLARLLIASKCMWPNRLCHTSILVTFSGGLVGTFPTGKIVSGGGAEEESILGTNEVSGAEEMKADSVGDGESSITK